MAMKRRRPAGVRWYDQKVMMFVSNLRFAPLALALLGLVAPAVAQTPPPPEPEPDSTFVESVEVNLVELEVFVTDRDGKPITDLGVGDFTVIEDKRQVEITNFSSHVEGVEVRRAVDGKPVEVPPPIASGLERLEEIPAEQRLHLVIYVDNFNIRPFNRNRTFRRVREFVRNAMRPGDRVMLASYERSLKERVAFTADPARVVNALYDMEDESGFAQGQDSEREELLRAIQDSRETVYALGRVRMHAENITNDQGFAIDALKEFLGPMAGLPGRKVVVHVSDGLPMVPGHDLFIAVSEQFRESSALMESRQYDLARRYQEVARLANASGVTFYMIDAAGLRVYGGSASSRFHADYGSRLESARTYNLQSPLQLISEETGGFAIVNTNDVGDRLDQVAQEMRTYYSIGYMPPGGGGSGRYRDIAVKVNRPGRFTVRHRQGYRDKTVQARMRDGVLAALLWDSGGNPLGIDFEVGEGEPRERDQYVVPVSVKVPIGKVTLLPTESGQHVGRLRLYIGAMDSEGGKSEINEVPVVFEIPAAELTAAQAGWYRYDLSLALRGGFQRLSIAARDEVAGEDSYVTRGVQIGSRR
jgi:VWFA-related protein